MKNILLNALFILGSTIGTVANGSYNWNGESDYFEQAIGPAAVRPAPGHLCTIVYNPNSGMTAAEIDVLAGTLGGNVRLIVQYNDRYTANQTFKDHTFCNVKEISVEGGDKGISVDLASILRWKCQSIRIPGYCKLGMPETQFINNEILNEIHINPAPGSRCPLWMLDGVRKVYFEGVSVPKECFDWFPQCVNEVDIWCGGQHIATYFLEGGCCSFGRNRGKIIFKDGARERCVANDEPKKSMWTYRKSSVKPKKDKDETASGHEMDGALTQSLLDGKEED
jgi:hypothetical protein